MWDKQIADLLQYVDDDTSQVPYLLKARAVKLYTEAKRCFATHDEDNDYFNMRIYIILIACVYIQQFNFIQ